MHDLISRQAAVDALDVLCQEHRYKIPGKIETYSQYNEAWQDALDRAEGAIFNLPPAHPELTDDQAITHLQSSGWMQRHDKEMYERGIKEQLADDSDSYDSLLPSAQPERKRGKWIYEGIRGRFPACRCSVCGSIENADWAVIQDGANFCPHCGADMRGEKDETD